MKYLSGWPVIGLALGAALAMSPLKAQETYYKWTDANGAVHYSDTPPEGRRANVVRVRQGASVTSETAAPAPAATSAVAPLQQVEQAWQEQACRSARNDLAILKSGKLVVAGDSPEEAKRMSDADREASMAGAQARVEQYCHEK